VIVNGVPVLEGGRYTGAKPGKVLRGPGWDGRP
jgi:N-acyl-D-amino-acid deacylase